jgi:hypothetical protein
MLSGSEQETLCGLAVFRGGFTAQAAKQVAGASLEILESLSQNYLVRFFQDESRYHMHELVRQFAESKLQGQGNKNAYYQKHSYYFLNKLEDWNLQQKGSRLVNALAEMDGDVLNIQASWEWACQQGNISSLVRSWQGLCLYYQYRYRWTEGEHACQSGLKLLDGIKKINPLGKRLKVGLLMYQALFQNLYEEFVQNLEYYGTITNQCLELLETLQQEGEDVRCEKAWVLREKSATITDFEKRLEAAQTSLELTMQIGDRWSISLSLANLAKVHYYAANFEAAERICQDAITECRRLNNLWGLSGALFLMSEITMHLGKLDIAINSAQEYYRVIVSLGKKELYCVGLAAIGMVYITMGKW